jgi:signal peptidase II
MSPKLRTMLILIAVVLPLDQVSKYWVDRNVSPFAPIVVIDGFFNITHARNPGMALGLFQEVPVAAYVVLTIAALGMILSFFRRVPPTDLLSALALGLITSGALGNLVDRVLRGEVVDFLQFDLGLFVFPDFNVADSAIVVGVALLLLEVLASEAEEEGARRDGGSQAA